LHYLIKISDTVKKSVKKQITPEEINELASLNTPEKIAERKETIEQKAKKVKEKEEINYLSLI